jgi:hypothetical protein
MSKILFFLCLLLNYNLVWGQSDADHTITINKQSFGNSYPAVLLDFKTGKITKLDKDFKEEDISGDADMWIEPRDPEINCLERSEDGKLKGETPHIVIAAIAYDKLDDKNMPQAIDKNGLQHSEIKEGTVFLLQASNNAVYKVRIDRTDKETETIILTYKLLRK